MARGKRMAATRTIRFFPGMQWGKRRQQITFMTRPQASPGEVRFGGFRYEWRVSVT
ncbi:hypothetical protein GCM10008094_27410 [Aidingimonas halophila]|nr:hypothetical protein GCM10008094_27410 [Aidingimonas halophila]